MQPYLTSDMQASGSIQVTVGTTSVPVVPARDGNMRRTQITITNETVGASMRVNKGTQAASATVGLPISTTQTYIEGDDGGYTCFQGQFNVRSDIVGTVTVTETLEPRGR